MILDNYQTFLASILDDLNKLGVDVSGLEMDHIGYQASSDADYDRLTKEFEKIGERVSEVSVGGRRVGIYKLKKPLQYERFTPDAIELVAPKIGQVCPSALDHVEFVIQESFDSFMRKYPSLAWDTSAITQPVFPMIKISLSNNTQVKFHWQPVLDIVQLKIKR